jgi:hypothetical protein
VAQAFPPAVEHGLCGCSLGFQAGGFFLQGVQPVFFIVELPRIALQQSFFVDAPFERFHVFAQALLVVEDLFGFFFARVFLCVEALHDGLLREDLP